MIEHAKRQESAEALGIEYHVLDAAALATRFVPQSLIEFYVKDRDG